MSCAKGVFCYLQSQGHSEDSYNQNTIVSTVFRTADPFATKLCLMVHHHKANLVKRMD